MSDSPEETVADFLEDAGLGLVKEGATGAPTILTNEACTKLSTTIYQITDTTKRRLDPLTPPTVEVDALGNGGWVTADPDDYEVDEETGTITFDSALAATALVRISGKYLPYVQANLFTGEARPTTPGIPRRAVFVLATGGRAPAPILGTGESIWVPRVQIRVRDEAPRRSPARDLARSILQALHAANVSGYWLCLAQQPEPIYLGPDKTGLHEFTVNVELSRVE